jgi:hypothetical protein
MNEEKSESSKNKIKVNYSKTEMKDADIFWIGQ